jgi:hypothetical protein
MVFRAGAATLAVPPHSTPMLTRRSGNSRANQNRSQLPRLRWAADDQAIRVVEVQYPFVSTTGVTPTPLPKLALSCRRFVPGPTDTLRDVWSGDGGAELVLDFPEFACVGGPYLCMYLGRRVLSCWSLTRPNSRAIPIWRQRVLRSTLKIAGLCSAET